MENLIEWLGILSAMIGIYYAFYICIEFIQNLKNREGGIMNKYFNSQILYDRFEGIDGTENAIKLLKEAVKDVELSQVALERILEKEVKQTW